MKRILIASVLALTTATTFAAAADLSSAVAIEVRQLVPGADLSGLTLQQTHQIESLFLMSDNLRSGNNPAGAIKAILSQQ